jgi:hypothetical protein
VVGRPAAAARASGRGQRMTSNQMVAWGRVVDADNQGWYSTRSSGGALVYCAGYRREDLPERSLEELAATRGPLRPVLHITDDDDAEMRRLFAQAGRKTIATLAAALETVFHQLRESRGGLGAHDSYEFAMRTIKAGRAGSWEAEALDAVLWFGNELNLPKVKGVHDSDVDGRRAAGPGKRVDFDVHRELTAMLTRWVTDPARYTEVAETLASVVSSYADDTAGPDGWRAVADQWLQPGGLANETFVACYRLLYSTSAHLDTSLL